MTVLTDQFPSRRSSILVCLMLFQAVVLANEEVNDDTSASKQISITGHIATETGSAVPSAQLQVWTFREEPRRHWEQMNSPAVHETGTFEINDLDAPASLLFRVQADDMATGWSMQHINEGGHTEITIAMSPPGQVKLQVNDESGEPISDASIRWMKIEGPNGSVSFSNSTIRDLEWTQPTSDGPGLLLIEDMPLSAKLTVGLLHNEYAPAEAKGVSIVEQAEPLTIVMNEGIPLSIQILSNKSDVPLQEVMMDLRHQPFVHPSTLIDEHIPLDASGHATIRIEPGSYRLLRFTHPDVVIGPELTCDYDKQTFLELNNQTPRLTFHASPKAEVRGKAVDALTGEPIKEQYVIGETPNPQGVKEFADFVRSWRTTAWAQTDSEGSYTMKLASGRVRISLRAQGYTTSKPYVQFDVSGGGVAEVPTLEVVPINPVKGTVIGPEGQPVKDAAVRFRGEHLRWEQPVITDENGQFELNVSYIPQDDQTEEMVFQHPVVAFHPQHPWVGTAWVNLDQPNETDHLEIALHPTDDWDLTHLFEDELTPQEQGHLREEERAELESMSLVEKPAPELDGRSWLNTPQSQMSLADFRGKYVLLDFWTTWCGPCHGDLPSLKLLQQLYGGENFTIIGVHDNSVDPEKIAEHVKKEGMEYPIVIDHSDGRILREYESHGISGYPSYLLIGPDGRVLLENRTAGGPSLRVYKLEIVRQFLKGNIEAE